MQGITAFVSYPIFRSVYEAEAASWPQLAISLKGIPHASRAPILRCRKSAIPHKQTEFIPYEDVTEGQGIGTLQKRCEWIK
jgi:hypothetical protein